MKVLIQRVKYAKVTIDGQIKGKIDHGYLLLVGITHEDNETIVHKLAHKVRDLRLFEDENGKMNLGIEDVGGKVLSISQFTLYADCKKGRRPSFTNAAKPDLAEPLYEAFNQELRNLGLEVETGIFGADMKVELYNDGPVTIMLDSQEL
ncbi:MAG: D-aminoacyl-tRNA deacylase [Erysipelotrichaceae bacterium]|nr:D-aminoacyl-tRNA deacylase [Erysipelotrichaceae bacterium]